MRNYPRRREDAYELSIPAYKMRPPEMQPRGLVICATETPLCESCCPLYVGLRRYNNWLKAPVAPTLSTRSMGNIRWSFPGSPPGNVLQHMQERDMTINQPLSPLDSPIAKLPANTHVSPKSPGAPEREAPPRSINADFNDTPTPRVAAPVEPGRTRRPGGSDTTPINSLPAAGSHGQPTDHSPNAGGECMPFNPAVGPQEIV